MNADSYWRVLLALMPRGIAWAGRLLSNLLRGFSAEPARVEGRAMNLIDEADPRTTFEMLPDFEDALGLPDPCVAINQTVAQRRMQVVAKLNAQGGQSAAYFIGLAALLGYQITIDEFDQWSVDDDVDTPFFGAQWAFAWRVNAPLNTLVEWTVDDDVDTPFAVWSNLPLECVLRRYSPAHTIVVFSYS